MTFLLVIGVSALFNALAALFTGYEFLTGLADMPETFMNKPYVQA